MSEELTTDEIEEIKRTFNFESPIILQELQGGLANKTFKLTAKNQTVILKLCVHPCANLSTQAIVSDAASRNGVLVSRYIPVPNIAHAKVFVYHLPRFPVMVSEYLPGKCPEKGSNTLCDQVGEQLAKLNSLLSVAPELDPLLADFKQEYFYDTMKLLEKLEPDSVHYNHEVIREWRESVPFIENLIFNPDVRLGLLHTDVFLSNMICDDQGNLLGLIDFECVSKGPLLFEIGVTILGVCYDEHSINLEQVKHLVEAYDKVTPLSEDEKRLIPQFHCYSLIFYSFWRYWYLHIHGDPLHPNYNSYLLHWNRLLLFKSNGIDKQLESILLK